MNTSAQNNIQILSKGETVGWSSDTLFTQNAARNALRFHRSLPGYQETELRSLSSAAKKYGVKAIYVKDEPELFTRY